jgi:aminoglycoside phosphotransferase (APT) family kinase protein
VQNTGTGRLTLRYDFDPDHIIYAKLYSDGLGIHSYQVMKDLWDGGFGQSAQYQVPEPLAFLPTHNLVLMRGVTGKPVGTALNGDCTVDLVEGSREAARWLAALHRCEVKVGEPEADWDSLKIFRVCVRMIKAAAAKPEHHGMLLDLMHSLKNHIRKMPSSRLVVQTHGRYHHDHVFINGGATAVIDLDRSRPSDPAKDVAEYVRVLRMTAFKGGVEQQRIEDATKAFLDEYLAEVPEAAESLPYYWASFLVLSLFGFVKKLKVEDPNWQKMMDFHLREMRRVMEINI